MSEEEVKEEELEENPEGGEEESVEPTGDADKEEPEAKTEEPESAPENVPKSRFDEVIAERNALREESHKSAVERAKLEGQLNAQVPVSAPAPVDDGFDMDAALEKQMDAVADNDKKAYAEITKKINDHNLKQVTPAPVEHPSQAETDEKARWSYSLGKMNDMQLAAVRDYSVLDQNKPEFDRSMAEDVIGWYEINLQREMWPHDAMEKALTKVVEGYGSNGSSGVDTAEESKKRADAISGQPGRQSGGGAGGEVSAKSKLDNWDDLPEKERKSMLFPNRAA